MDRKKKRWGIQFVGSSLAKKVIVLRKKFYFMWLSYNLFICIINIRLLKCYVRYWDLGFVVKY